MKKQIQATLDSLATFITEHQYEDTPILTAYVGVDSTDQDNRRDRPAWLIELKNQAKLIEEQYGEEALKRRSSQNKWANTEEMVLSHLNSRKPEGRSTVIFTDHEDMLTIGLPVPLPTRLYYGVPQLKPLLFALDSHKKYLVALFSEDELKLVEIFLTAPTEEIRVEAGVEGGIRLTGAPRKDGTLASDRRDREFERRIAAEAAEKINEHFLADSDIEHIVFGGNLQLAHAAKKSLHSSVYSSLVTIQSLAYNSTNNEIAQIVRRIADEQEIEHDLALVDELISRRHAGGTAVLETQGVLLALEQGRASKVVISMPIDSDKFDKLLIQSIINNCDIEFVHGEAAEKLNKFGGIAAILYYSAS